MPDRSLTDGEIREARTVYGGRIDYGRVTVHEGKYMPFQPDNTAMAPNGDIYFPTPIFRPDYSINADAMSFLIHELAHVWQVQRGVWLRFQRVFIDGGDYDYDLDVNKALTSYKVEEQAAIIADYYRVRHGLGPQHGSGTLQAYQQIVQRAMAG